MMRKRAVYKRGYLFFLLILMTMFAVGCGTREDILETILSKTNQAEAGQSPQKAEVPQVLYQEDSTSSTSLEENLSQEDISQETFTSESSEAVPEEDIYSFTKPTSSYYAYESLSESEQIWYRDMQRILGQMLEEENLSQEGLDAGLNENDVDKIFQCVLNDHPEYFYVEGYTYTKYTRGDQLVKLELSGDYSIPKEEAIARETQIKETAAAMLTGIGADAGDYEKVKYVYDTIIKNTEYDLLAPDNQNVYSVFVNKRSVCQGYAKSVQYLLNQLGVECTIVMGTVHTGEGHAWNLVKVDGSFYYLDATWGDASYQSESGEVGLNTAPEINYDYMCVTTNQLLRTHILGGSVPMPQCVSLEANYYVREGVYFTEYDEEQLFRIFQEANEQGRKDVTLKSADLVTYLTMENALIEQQKIFNYLDTPDGEISYATNEKQLSMTFWMTND
jgi:transglutaminase-like putative cysteine protease